MSDSIIHLKQELIHTELKDLVRNSVEEKLNVLLITKTTYGSMPGNMSVPVTAKGSTDLPIIRETFKPLRVK